MLLLKILHCLKKMVFYFFPPPCWQAVHVHCIATEPTFFGNYAPPDDLDGQIIDLAPQQSMMYTLKPPVVLPRIAFHGINERYFEMKMKSESDGSEGISHEICIKVNASQNDFHSEGQRLCHPILLTKHSFHISSLIISHHSSQYLGINPPWHSGCHSMPQLCSDASEATRSKLCSRFGAPCRGEKLTTWQVKTEQILNMIWHDITTI